MKISTAHATWEGSNIREGKGTMKVDQGEFEVPFTYVSRFEQGKGTSPEELIGAAHAGCYSMALTATLARAGLQAERVQTDAKVYLDPAVNGISITKIELTTVATIPGADDAAFQQLAEDAKKNCVVSKALSVEIDLKASLKS